MPGIVINHNLIAMNAARNLDVIYGRMAKSIQRLSTGQRINSAADDAAGLAIREQMRTDIRVLGQGIRNASDAISMIQTAEGAMAVIDEKLIRMKELAEQAATGTYTTQQRIIINSEYQAMAAEIDRIANATTFNGIHLLDGSLSKSHQGAGLKVHFGLGNNAAEDYYYINTGDVRATYATGLRVGNADARDTLRTTGLNAPSQTAPLNTGHGTAASAGDGLFGIRFHENYNNEQPDAGTWNLYGYVAIDASRTSINDIVQQINQGAQAQGSLAVSDLSQLSGATLARLAITINGQVFSFASASGQGSYSGASGVIYLDSASRASIAGASAKIVEYINNHAASIGVYAAHNSSTIALVAAQFGTHGNQIDTFSNSRALAANQQLLSGGGRQVLTASSYYDELAQTWQLQLQMNQGGEKYRLQTFGFASISQTAGSATIMGGGLSGVAFKQSDQWMSQLYASSAPLADNGRVNTYAGLNAPNQWLLQQQGDGDSDWNGNNVLTQSSAQRALSALDAAITKKDTTRAGLGAAQNRLESTIAVMQIQTENLQAAESRISDVDVAAEMTELMKNQIKARIALAVLSQANALPQLILTLITGR